MFLKTKLSANNAYFSQPDGLGTQYFAGDIISETTTIYIYATSETIPNCIDQSNFTITISSEITPTFDPVTACQGASVTLPTTSLNGVVGVWSGTGITPEGVVDTSVGGEFTFTFTPDVELSACAIAVEFTVTITATVVGTFESLQTTYCLGDAVSALPTTSDNGVEGTWDIGTIDTSVASGDEPFVYTFTPNAECNNVTTVSVIVNAPTAPLFANIALTYCEGDEVSALPTISDNGITGQWNDDTIDTTIIGTTPYTFTPTPGQCASPIILNITVNAKIPSNFNAINPVCVGEELTLPTTSLEGTVGTWSGAGISPEGVVDTSVANNALEVTFIPTGCAEEQIVTIQIVARPAVDPGVDQTVCAADGAFPLPSLTNGVYYSGPNGTGDLLVGTIPVSNTPQTVYIFAAGTLAGCSSESSFTVTFVEVEADELSDVEECTRYFLPELSAGNVYYTGPGQTGTQLFSGQAVEQSQMIYVSAGSPSSCYDETSFEVVIINCGIQKGISPNGDGLNDFFDLTAFDVRTLSIYNRYGTKVYNRGNYSNEWYGQSNGGDELPDGTYYFVIEFNNIEAKTGWIYINRER